MSYKITKRFIEELLAKINIVRVIKSVVPDLKKSGEEYRGKCPFHKDNTPSFYVNKSRQVYYCFGCHASGNVITFYKEYYKKDFPSTVKELATQVNMSLPKIKDIEYDRRDIFFDLNRRVAEDFALNLTKSDRAKLYLKDRNLTLKIIKLFHLGFANNQQEFDSARYAKDRAGLIELGLIKKGEYGLYSFFRDRIIFPIRNLYGEIVGFGGRALSNQTPKYLHSPGSMIFVKREELYGLYETLKIDSHPKRLIIVEGYFDLLALFQQGIDYVIATLGTAISKEQIAKLFRYTKEVIICFDGDEAGRKAAWRTVELILPIFQDSWRVKFLFLEENMDPDSFISKYGKDLFLKNMEASQYLSQFFFNYLANGISLDKIEEQVEFASNALQYLNKIKAPLMRAIFFQKLLDITKISQERLNSLLKRSANEKIDYQNIKSGNAPSSLRMEFNPCKKATYLLLQKPELALLIDKLELSSVKGSKLLKRIIEFIKENPECKREDIIKHWQNDEVVSYIFHTFTCPQSTPITDNVDEEFVDCIVRLNRFALEEKIDKLIAKKTHGELNSDEVKKLQKLLRELKSKEQKN